MIDTADRNRLTAKLRKAILTALINDIDPAQTIENIIIKFGFKHIDGDERIRKERAEELCDSIDGSVLVITDLSTDLDNIKRQIESAIDSIDSDVKEIKSLEE